MFPSRWASPIGPGIVAALAALVWALAGCGGTAGEPGRSPSESGDRVSVGAGTSVHVPRGWHVISSSVTAISFPQERLLLTSYRTARGPGCAPTRAERELPADGALVHLFEYRPGRGSVWRNVRRSDFPPRPARFVLRREALANYECWRIPTYLIRFRAADRPFQMHVALGKRAGTPRRAQVLRILDSLRFEPLPPPPPDPYAGWHELINETGDTIRTPPRWPAAVTTGPRRYARPRALFFASNARLPGLPRSAPAGRLGRSRARRLPSPLPERALGSFPDRGVLLWVLEEPKGPVSDSFPALPHRRWPEPGDFRTVRAGPAARWPTLAWERAAGAQHRHRFSVWVISSGDASDADLALARKAAAALALSSGDFRDAPCTRGCRSG